MSSDESSIADCAAQSVEEITIGLARERICATGASFRQIGSSTFGSRIMGDPWSTIKGIYRKLGRELSTAGENSMRAFLATHPSDGGGKRYTWSDTGLDAAEVREQVRAYQQRYDVPTESLR